MTTLYESFLQFGTVLLPLVEQAEPRNEPLVQQLTQTFSALTPAHGPSVEEALVGYFDQPPAHIAAVNALDHSQFVNALVLHGVGTLCLRTILEIVSRQGPIPYGRVWLSLLQVAERANPTQVRSREGREYIMQQMAMVPSQPQPQGTAPPMPSPAQLDNIMGSVLSAFPGLQDCIGKIIQGASQGNGGEADLNSVVDQVQNVLLGPLLQNTKSTNPDAPDISEPLSQILNGFRGLNSIVAAGNKGSTDTADTGNKEEMDT